MSKGPTFSFLAAVVQSKWQALTVMNKKKKKQEKSKQHDYNTDKITVCGSWQ